MKRIRNILAIVSLLTFVVSFAAFSISAFIGFYGNLALFGLISFVAFAVMLLTAGTPDNETYLKGHGDSSSGHCVETDEDEGLQYLST
ncbi:MAG: hypothetical protein ACI4B3_10245 [Prevotella sp.]